MHFGTLSVEQNLNLSALIEKIVNLRKVWKELTCEGSQTSLDFGCILKRFKQSLFMYLPSSLPPIER